MMRAQRLEAAPSPSARQPQRSLPAPDAFRDTRLQDRSNPERPV